MKAISRHEVLCTLEDVVREGAKVLKPGGRMYMVHRPHRLIEIFGTMKQYKLEPKRMKMVHPFKDKEHGPHRGGPRRRSLDEGRGAGDRL